MAQEAHVAEVLELFEESCSHFDAADHSPQHEECELHVNGRVLPVADGGGGGGTDHLAETAADGDLHRHTEGDIQHGCQEESAAHAEQS